MYYAASGSSPAGGRDRFWGQDGLYPVGKRDAGWLGVQLGVIDLIFTLVVHPLLNQGFALAQPVAGVRAYLNRRRS